MKIIIEEYIDQLTKIQLTITKNPRRKFRRNTLTEKAKQADKITKKLTKF